MNDFRNAISETYDGVAERAQSAVCCAPSVIYTPEELAALPEQTTRMSSGCGNPVRFSQITPGSTVVDLGSGAGLDACLSARLTGPTGRVIGVDPSEKMRAQANKAVQSLNFSWVEFLEGTAENIPLPDGIADVVISNCVLSLALDCERVWREVARVLKPGGRFTVSDVVGGIRGETPESKARCETGVEWADYRRFLVDAGLSAIHIHSASAVEFRDGKRIQSATIRGSRRPQDREASSVQIFHAGLDQVALSRLVQRTAKTFGAAGIGANVETLSLFEEGVTGLLHLIRASSEIAMMLKLPRNIYVVVDGVCGAHADDGDAINVEALVQHTSAAIRRKRAA